MDPARDNPLVRFSSFWLGALIFVLFGLACLVIVPLLGGKEEDAMDAATSERRIENLREMQAAQDAVLTRDQVSAHFRAAGEGLLAVQPAPMKVPTQVVPGSPTAEKLAADTGPPPDVEELAADAPVDPAVMELGKAQYILCMACHGADGNGVANIAPPLAGSEWVTGPVQNLIRIQLRGLTGPITVKGKEYNLPAPMVAQAFQTDEQVAAVLTYIRNSWGNKASPVTPEMVKALRGEVGKPPLTAADLIPPTGDKPAGDQSAP
ncbi:MAG: cytochrome c [Akkermansiaceae bacterium]|nr:cytochrome c [Akkermansiaceae bacterium]NNM30655.1 cytochrome c [Akkermansiaceae bacterium]